MLDMIETSLEKFGNVFIIQGNKNLPALFSGADHFLIAQAAQLMRNG